MEKSFGTALNCIDGRTQIPVTNWMKENFGVEYVDMVTEPGVDKVLSQWKLSEMIELRNKVEVSVKAHKSSVIAIVGHYDCAANPVSDEEHYSQIAESTDIVKNWDFPVKVVVGLWVDEFWCVHVVKLYRRVKY
jgi:hypothetical protein